MPEIQPLGRSGCYPRGVKLRWCNRSVWRGTGRDRASGVGSSAVYEVIDFVAGGGWAASVHEAFSLAIEIGIRSWSSDDSQLRALESDNSLTTSSRLSTVAYNRGPRPLISSKSGLTSPRSRRSFLRCSRPHSAANHRSVRPFLSGRSGLISPCSRSRFTISVYLLQAAENQGVRPASGVKLGLTSGGPISSYCGRG